MDGEEALIVRKVAARIVPLLMLSYFAAYLDRVNLSFAAATMNRDLHLSATAFGFGAGIFFLGYVLFEVPSNLAMRRFGARRWFTRIMLSWGVVSFLFAFARNETQFVILRFLLGAAEAGLFPGVVLYLSEWFPAEHRARYLAAFAVALPASAAIGAPMSGLVLKLDGLLGLPGWQWLFMTEAVPSLLMALAVFLWLPDSPAQAGWLDERERRVLAARLATDRREAPGHRAASRAALRDGRVWLFGLAYCGIVAANYGVGFWLPQIVGAFGLGSGTVGLLSGLPYAVGAVGMIWWGRRSDRRRERRWHAVVPGVVAAAALVASALTGDLTLKMLALTVAGFGAFANLPVFWSLPSTFLSAAAAPAGIAVISSIGNVAGFAAPYAMGALRDATGGFTAGLLTLAVFILAAISLLLPLGRGATWNPVSVASTTPEEHA